jgi:hypothetical protein
MSQSSKHHLTLVTSFLNYYHTPLHERTIELRLSRMVCLFEWKIPIVVYVSPDLVGPFETYIKSHYSSNTHIRMVPLQRPLFESSYAYLIAKEMKLTLPEKRHHAKDTLEYMCYTHSKIGFIHHVSRLNPFETTHFAWIDYDISTMWKSPMRQMRYLQYISQHGIQSLSQLPPTEHAIGRHIKPEHELYVPVCREKPDDSIGPISIEDKICKEVYWRFCTNFFLGTSTSIKYLYQLYTEHYEHFLSQYETMVWDMNFWAYLEQETDWQPISYKANHDDRIIQEFPLYALANPIQRRGTSCMLYPLGALYKESHLDHSPYYPSSSSCIVDPISKRTILNMRYVNYYYLPSGHCTHGVPIQTFNRMYVLDPYTKELNLQYRGIIVDETAETMGLPEPDPKETFQGVEDIRLFQYGNTLKFLATTVNHSGCACARMVYGDYVLIDVPPESPTQPPIQQTNQDVRLQNVRVLEPPDSLSTKREKNWIPFVSQKEPDKLYFIYQWASPFQMGVLIEESRLQIRYTYPVSFPMQEEIRGSSNLVLDPHMGKYVALVHISVENTLPKQYYHMLVWLDPITYRPCAHSKLIYFWKFGVEFCLNMEIKDEGGQYGFWFSTMDRDPRYVSIDRTFFTGSMQEYVFFV